MSFLDDIGLLWNHIFSGWRKCNLALAHLFCTALMNRCRKICSVIMVNFKIIFDVSFSMLHVISTSLIKCVCCFQMFQRHLKKKIKSSCTCLLTNWHSSFKKRVLIHKSCWPLGPTAFFFIPHKFYTCNIIS